MWFDSESAYLQLAGLETRHVLRFAFPKRTTETNTRQTVRMARNRPHLNRDPRQVGRYRTATGKLFRLSDNRGRRDDDPHADEHAAVRNARQVQLHRSPRANEAAPAPASKRVSVVVKIRDSSFALAS